MTAHNPHKQMINGNVTLGLDPKVGDHAHVLYYSDIHPCTVVKRTKKFVWVQMDNYKLAEGEKPNIIPGGFAGHCTNQRQLKYDITRNLKGAVSKFGLRANGKWCRCGQHDANPTSLGKGWRAFYDYNF